jgi:hypothetical protein
MLRTLQPCLCLRILLGVVATQEHVDARIVDFPYSITSINWISQNQMHILREST